jgi:flavin reductase (DIM6/NTAB) family NADH-FMN oxidoreductase RutF
MKFNRSDINQMESRFRAQFINSLTGYKPANLIGTVDSQGKTNLAIISSVVHLGSHPPLLAFINRPNSVARNTFENIKANGCYSINHLHQDNIQAGHQTSARYSEEVSEFTACGFTEQWVEGFDAPLVQESTIKLGMRYIEDHLLLNETIMIIGEVETVELPDDILRTDGSLDIAAANTVATGGLDTYYGAELLARFSYASPDTLATEI